MFSPLRETGFAEFKGPPLLPHNLIPFLSSNSRPGQGYSECAVELHWGEGELPLGARTVFLGGRCQDPRLQREPVKHKGRDLQTLLRFHSVVNTQIRAGVSTQDLASAPMRAAPCGGRDLFGVSGRGPFAATDSLPGWPHRENRSWPEGHLVERQCWFTELVSFAK